MSLQDWLLSLAAFGSMVIALIQAIALRKFRAAKTNHEENNAAATLVEGTKEFANMLRSELERMSVKVDRLDAEIVKLRANAHERDREVAVAREELSVCAKDRLRLHAENAEQGQKIAEQGRKIASLESKVRELEARVGRTSDV